MIQPITIQLGGSFGYNDPALGVAGNPLFPILYDIPQNRRMVIETVSALVYYIANSPNAHSATLTLSVREAKTGNSVGEYQLPLSYQATYDPLADGHVYDWWSMNSPMKAYVPWGGRLALHGKRGPNSDWTGEVRVTIAGYLESLTLINIPWLPF